MFRQIKQLVIPPLVSISLCGCAVPLRLAAVNTNHEIKAASSVMQTSAEELAKIDAVTHGIAVNSPSTAALPEVAAVAEYNAHELAEELEALKAKHHVQRALELERLFLDQERLRQDARPQ